MKIFNAVQSFFDSIGEYINNFSYLFLIFLGAFAVVSIIVIIVTSFAYECMLTKTIDKINKFLERNPRINDDNLVAFNNLMKGRKVPKVLRRQWQQFMLYREHPVSYYMSFKHCVENPLRNSAYRQQMTIYKIISYILVALSLVVSVFMARQSVNANFVLQDVVIVPIALLICYWIVSMVLDLIHNATTSDLFQNYQYFEINMDKAMVTLPEFVDYEVLFSQEEIKKGIPVLFAYLQKRAVQEQQELEKARLKSVDHEKFDFDKAGLDGSLVLDRAMRETENFSSQRKKYLQEIERVNNEISALETNYKEQVKEYQRQVQTSKETVENLKSQLEQAASTIEINYIKKQIRDEINRQQVAEKDFDTTTDKYNQEIRNLKQEIKNYDDETDKAKEALETSMLSEFNTYSVKVYNNLEKIVEEKMQDKISGYRNQIKDLEEQLESRNEELDNVYARYQEVLSQNPVEATYQEEPQVKGKKNKNKNKNANEQNLQQENQNVDEYGQYNDYNNDNYTSNENLNQDYNYTEQNQDYNNSEYVQNYEQNEDYQNYDNQQNYAQDNQYQEYNQDAQYNQNEQNQEYDNQYTNEDYNVAQEQNGEYYNTQDNIENTQSNEYYQQGNQDYQQGQYYQMQDEQADNLAGDMTDSNTYVPLNDDYSNVSESMETPLNDDNYSTENNDLDNEEDKANSNHNNFDENDFDLNFEENKKPYNYNVDDDIFAKYSAKSNQHNDGFSGSENSVENADTRHQEVNSNNVENEEFDIDKILDVDNITASNNGSNEETLVKADEDELPAPNIIKRKAGRPRKIVDETEVKPKRGPGRPKKVIKETATNTEMDVKRGPGRPKKDKNEVEKRPVGRPKKTRGPGRPKKVSTENKPKGKVGRPKKNSK